MREKSAPGSKGHLPESALEVSAPFQMHSRERQDGRAERLVPEIGQPAIQFLLVEPRLEGRKIFRGIVKEDRHVHFTPRIGQKDILDASAFGHLEGCATMHQPCFLLTAIQ